MFQIHTVSGYRAPAFLRFRSSKGFTVVAVSLATFTDVFVYASIVPVVPLALSDRLNIPASDVQYWVSVFLAVNGAAILIMSPIAGWFADRTGSRRLPLILGLLALAGAAALLCYGNTISAHLTGRALLGFSGAVVWTAGLALILDTVEKDEVGRYLGYVFLGINFAVMVGPLVGGLLFASLGYNSVFYFSFVLIGLDVVLRMLLVEKKNKKKAGENPTASEDARQTVSEASEADALLPGRSTGSGTQILIFTLLKSPRVLTAMGGCLVQSCLFSTFDTVLSLRVRALFGWNSVGGGLIFLALLIPSFASPVIGRLNDLFGPKTIACTGFILAGPVLVLLQLIDHDGVAQIVLLCVLLFFIGTGLNAMAIPLAAEIPLAIDAEETKNPGVFGPGGAYAQGYALLNMGFSAGGFVGPVWAGFVTIGYGWRVLWWSLGALCFLTAVPVAVWTGGRSARESQQDQADRTARDIPVC